MDELLVEDAIQHGLGVIRNLGELATWNGYDNVGISTQEPRATLYITSD